MGTVRIHGLLKGTEMNRITITGNLTRDPELRTLPSGTQVCNFGLASNRKYKGKDGQMTEEVCFVDVVAFSQTADLIARYLSKGRKVLVDGRLKLDQWEKDGQKRSKHSIVLDRFEFMDSAKGGGESGGGSGPGSVDPDDDMPF